eukprot:s12_g19.t1
MRKFSYKEWQDEDVTKRVATAFAKQCHRRKLEFKFAKNKKDKIAYMNDIGIKSMNGKEIVADLETLLEQAIHRALVLGKVDAIEEHLRSIFKTEIGADTVDASDSIKEGVTFNTHKGVFQAALKIDDQAFVKEFPVKQDALHWLDLLKSLSNKKLLKGQAHVMKAVAANRKATQEAYDKILSSKKIFVPEENSAYQKNPSDGKDIWTDMFPKYEEPEKPKFPLSSIRVPQASLEKMKLMGFEAPPVVGELWGWQHKTLGWRVNLIVRYKKVKIGKARAWEYFDTGSSSSVAPGGCFKEIEIQCIQRRVPGESFVVKPYGLTQPMASMMVGAFEKVLERPHKTSAEVGLSLIAGFKPVPVLADGFCFWHCFLRVSIPEEYNPVERNASGGPKLNEYLSEEIYLAKIAWEEFNCQNRL